MPRMAQREADLRRVRAVAAAAGLSTSSLPTSSTWGAPASSAAAPAANHLARTSPPHFAQAGPEAGDRPGPAAQEAPFPQGPVHRLTTPVAAARASFCVRFKTRDSSSLSCRRCSPSPWLGWPSHLDLDSSKRRRRYIELYRQLVSNSDRDRDGSSRLRNIRAQIVDLTPCNENSVWGHVLYEPTRSGQRNAEAVRSATMIDCSTAAETQCWPEFSLIDSLRSTGNLADAPEHLVRATARARPRGRRIWQ